MGASFTSWQYTNWANPLYVFQQWLVLTTLMFSNCQTTAALTQFNTRLTQLSGIGDWLGNLGGSLALYYT